METIELTAYPGKNEPPQNQGWNVPSWLCESQFLGADRETEARLLQGGWG